MSEDEKKQFFLFRIIKKIFYTGLVTILPTIIVISILIIAYNFLERKIGHHANLFIKNQLQGNWKNYAIKYLKIDPDLYKPVKVESYENLVERVKNSSLSFYEAKTNYDSMLNVYDKKVKKLNEKKANSNDFEYKKFLDTKINKIRAESGLSEAEKKFELEKKKLQIEINRENEIRLTKQKLGDLRLQKLKEEINKKYPDIIGIFIALIIIFIIGMIFTSYAGRSLNNFWEKTITKIPLIDKIYPYSKQLIEFIFEKKSVKSFKSVALVEYPRKGIYSLGFPTGKLSVNEKLQNKITLFIPSSPTPITGYTIIVDENDIIPLNITVEEAIRFCVTGGVITPKSFISKTDDTSLKKIQHKEKKE